MYSIFAEKRAFYRCALYLYLPEQSVAMDRQKELLMIGKPLSYHEHSNLSGRFSNEIL